MEINKIYYMDCLEGMKIIEDNTVDLVCIDPPYNIRKASWDKWKNTDDYINWMTKVFLECERVLKDNGSFYFFHNDFQQISKIQESISKETSFVFRQFITLNKANTRTYNWKNRNKSTPGFWEDVYNWYQTSEFLLYYTMQDTNSFEYKRNRMKKYIEYMNSVKTSTQLDLKELNKKFGYVAGCNWWFNEKQPRWVSRSDYETLRTYFPEFELSYEQLTLLLDDSKRPTFICSEDISTVWDWVEKNNGNHPTQKPLSLVERIIKASSKPHDTVLDCFMGSGTTAIACLRNNRNFIGFELDKRYFELANKRIEKEAG